MHGSGSRQVDRHGQICQEVARQKPMILWVGRTLSGPVCCSCAVVGGLAVQHLACSTCPLHARHL